MSAYIADFIAFDGIDGDNAQDQTVILLKDFELFGDAVGDKIENPGPGEIFSKRPGILLAGQVSAATIL